MADTERFNPSPERDRQIRENQRRDGTKGIGSPEQKDEARRQRLAEKDIRDLDRPPSGTRQPQPKS